MQKIIRWVNVLIVFLTLMTYLAPFVSPARFWPFAFIGLVYPTLLVFNLLFVVYWAVQRQWRALLSVGVILIGWNHFLGLVGFHFGQETVQGAPNIKLMTFNVYGFDDFHQRGLPAAANELESLVYLHQPDVLCMQEFLYDKQRGPAYLKALTQHNGLTHSVWKPAEELAIFSRYPILRSEVRYFGSTNGYRFADLQVGEQIIRVYNVHLRSNSITGLTNKVVDSGDLREKETWSSVGSILRNFKRAAQGRASQVEELMAHLANSPYPVLVCGDFNDIPQSYTYHRIRKKLDDAFLSSGSGIGITYAGRIPGLRIDYIFTDQRFTPVYCERGKVSFSDHRPVIAVIKL
ncbi:endonuclease/exonuclease/phosphatase family protein [Haliscomenobacter hydrossis]|uniref:Endonuclease/exonuclease/phosphatase n=1 Tax=Haliscomenobacter hydrossis (strain ATCC 27775 / DSM 1100 / LMG 10767 / O) TaxID=760192 RepID=F4KUC2_HALH1|nr:endonuclease/exonuclease/phosphatase family protein [Haliscomenobacter hydrossis]AEE51204.1 Endonuclease/exonuclease/phosphatase [Haliscomenobacter hydrossis DSM 1100]